MEILNKNRYRYLNIKGTVLDNYQFQNYMEKIEKLKDLKKMLDTNEILDASTTIALLHYFMYEN